MREQLIKTVKDRLGNKNGFTLIELMATLVILALIIAIAVPAIGKLVTQADESADKSSIALMERAGEMAELDGLKFDDAAPVNTELHPSITEKDVYMIPTLIEEGYLKLDDASKFNKPENYVKKVNKSGKFVYMGKGSTTPPGGTPGDGTPIVWNSKYLPFVTTVVNTENERLGGSGINNLSTSNRTFGDQACAKYHDITEGSHGYWEQRHCSDWYSDLFDRGLSQMNARVAGNDIYPDSVMKDAMYCYSEKMTGSAAPAGYMQFPDVKKGVMDYVMTPDGQPWMMAQSDCLSYMAPIMSVSDPAVIQGYIVESLIDQITREMERNNDYLPEYKNE